MMEDPLERIDYIHRSKIVRQIARLADERKNLLHPNDKVFTQKELMDHIIGELVDLIT